MDVITPLLHTTNLSRRFGEYEALKPTNLELLPGEMVALGGPNGAGKSTLLQCLSGLLSPTTGTITVEGHDLYEEERIARRGLAYVPDVPIFYQELTAWEHLYFIALAHQAADGFEQRAEDLLCEFDLFDARNLYPHAYSRGMRLKLGLALALIRPFRVLLLDEPSSALDEESTDLLEKKLINLCAAGAAVLLTTHDPQFAVRLNARLWHMQDGVLHNRSNNLGVISDEPILAE
ncbi:MAG: ABC transporter ATP-binding protein [Anaerolineaceae bacterium]|nr:ABC transporter ATP-binding protein [Anaerolineaceae bacterium]